jgi:hypothetical protein
MLNPDSQKTEFKELSGRPSLNPVHLHQDGEGERATLQ